MQQNGTCEGIHIAELIVLYKIHFESARSELDLCDAFHLFGQHIPGIPPPVTYQ